MKINSNYVIQAIKLIYPAIKDGFSYWETKQDGSSWGNPIDGLVWENSQFEKPTWSQIKPFLLSVELEAVRSSKIAEIKSVRDSKNIEPITSIRALVLDDEGNSTGKLSNFTFYTNRHPTNPASDPSSILTGAVVLNSTVPYSTKSLDGKKITVALTPEVARLLSVYLVSRNNDNYKLSDAIEAAIKKALTPAEVEAITWDPKYL